MFFFIRNEINYKRNFFKSNQKGFSGLMLLWVRIKLDISFDLNQDIKFEATHKN